MPFVHVELVEGRTPEQKLAIAKDITEAITKHAGAPASAIHVIFDDMKKEDYYLSGEQAKK
ncbi:MAG: tautomerase family protein [Streptococcaceae bacterium]|nr:tautomerase family protein [Streptococcaceae bacterium]MCL2681182.1 tautomerase family protein [Streptococcaceae bacterium]